MAPRIVGVDESGTHDKAPCICVAAVFGRQQQWDELARAWGPRARWYAENRNGYHATSALRKDNELLANETARWLQGLALTIDYKDFREVVTDGIRGEWGAEYQTALRAIAYVLSGYWRAHNIEWTTWVVEAGHSEQSAADKYLRELVKRRRDFRVMSYRWCGKEEIITHPADLAAHVFARRYAGETVPLADVLSTAVLHRHWERSEMEESVKQGEPFLREIQRERKRDKNRRRRERNELS